MLALRAAPMIITSVSLLENINSDVSLHLQDGALWKNAICYIMMANWLIFEMDVSGWRWF